MHNHSGLSGIKRQQVFSQLDNLFFDVVIIGGGITGAGLALDAASRGLKTLLIDQNDFASGTSSRSTKLIHGGLRYLKNLQFYFVAQLGRERNTLQKNYPYLIIPTKVILPIINGGQLKKFPSFLGLKLYDFLAAVAKNFRSQWISKKELTATYPIIRTEGLKGAFIYYEYKTNDGRLTIDTLKTAVELSAMAFNFCQATHINIQVGQITSIELEDLLHVNKVLVSTKCVINATGPWSSIVANQLGFPLPKSIYPTKGIHLVFDKERIPINHAFYFDAADGRMIFIIPKQNHVYIGTTDTYYPGDLRHPISEHSDIAYLIQSVNLLFPGLALTDSDVVSCWAGVRPLISETGKKTWRN